MIAFEGSIRLMRVLLGTNQLQKETGSEFLLAEFASHAKRAGAQVVVFSNWSAWPMSKTIERAGIPIVTEPADVRPLDYDIVYFQHQIAGLFDYSPHPRNAQNSLVVFAKLTPEGFLESGGWPLEGALGDLIFANSLETVEVIQEQGNTLPIRVFHNAVPGTFEPRRRGWSTRPHRIIAVAARADPNVTEALNLLEKQAQVVHVRRAADLNGPDSAQMVHLADLIVGSGRAIQYGLVSRTPVYVHNKHGGPGYLTERTFEAAASVNFSGRCTPRVRNASAIAKDIIDGYEEATRFTSAVPSEIVDRYALSSHFDALLQAPRSSNAERQKRLAEASGAVLRERRLADFVRSTFRKTQIVTRAAKP